jgi:iron complex transport system permease protein
MFQNSRQSNKRKGLLLLTVLLVVSALLALLFGRYPSPGLTNPFALATDPLGQSIIFNLRTPRIITAILLGMALGGAGFIFQQSFSNPLVEPGFLGVSPGAAFGSALAILLFSGRFFLIQTFAIVFSLGGLLLSLFIARIIPDSNYKLNLVFSGIIISALFSSGLGIIKYIADPLSQLPEITFWLLGGLWSAAWPRIIPIILPVLLSFLILFIFRWRINLMGLDDQVAFTSGFNVKIEKPLFLFTAVIGVALLTSIAGIVNWVGLIVPIISRTLFGGDARFTLPASMINGAIFVLICDTIARTLFAGEVPLGVLSALLGSLSFLIIVIFRRKKAL